MRKEFNEEKAYKIVGIIEMILSLLLTILFIVLIVKMDRPIEIKSLYASCIFTLTFWFVTFVTACWFLFGNHDFKENNESNNNEKE